MGTGSHLTSGILAALIHRGKTGKGQKIEVAMLDVAIPALTSVLAPVLQGRKFKRLGNRHWGVCPTNIYPASDGEVLIMVLTEAHWRTLAKLMGARFGSLEFCYLDTWDAMGLYTELVQDPDGMMWSLMPWR